MQAHKYHANSTLEDTGLKSNSGPSCCDVKVLITAKQKRKTKNKTISQVLRRHFLSSEVPCSPTQMFFVQSMKNSTENLSIGQLTARLQSSEVRRRSLCLSERSEMLMNSEQQVKATPCKV